MEINIKIEKMQITDIDNILDIEKSQNVKILSRKMLENDIKTSISMYYVARFNNQIIGYVAALYLSDHVDIESIVVDKNYTQNGVASKLMNHILTLSKSYRVKKIFIEVRVSNKPAIYLYEKFNFKNISLRKNYYSDKEDAYIYCLDL